MKFIYHFLFPLVFVAGSPYFGWRVWKRGNGGRGFFERFGFYPRAAQRRLRAMDRPVWIHAVSVGEMLLAQVLVRDVRRLRPQQDVVVTCTTSTARALAERELADARTLILYSPVDWVVCVRRAFRAIRPVWVVLMEQEIWPAQMWEAERRGIPVWIVNGRLSDRSWRRFKKYRRWVCGLLKPLAFVGLQRESDRERFAQAGFPVQALFYTGSMKCDVAELEEANPGLAEELRRQLGWAGDTSVFLGGSTHPGEEAVVLDAFAAARQSYPELKCFLAPRHAERAGAVVRLAQERGFRTIRRSEAAPGAEVVVLDTTGELRSLYALGTVVFGGKTLIAPEGKGGQNFLEAARVGCAIVLGPRVENFKNAAEEYAAEGALVQVEGVEALTTEILRLLNDPGARLALGVKARELFERELGVGARVAGMLDQVMPR